MPHTFTRCTLKPSTNNRNTIFLFEARAGEETMDRTIFTSCNDAAAAGDIEALQKLRIAGACWSPSTCAVAASRGQLAVLQWLRAQDPPCPWTARCYEFAVIGSQHKILEWLRAQDPPCPWDGAASSSAVRAGAINILRWLYAEGAPYGSYDPIHPDCAEFMSVEGKMWAEGVYECSAKPAKSSTPDIH